MQNEKLIVADLMDIALLGEVVTQCEVMSFMDESKIATLSRNCKKAIEKEIGDEYRDIAKDRKEIIDAISAPYIAEIQEAKDNGAGESDLEEMSSKASISIQSLAAKDDKIRLTIPERINRLMTRNVSLEVYPLIVEYQEYRDLFDKEARTVQFMDSVVSITGYKALLALAARGVIVVEKETNGFARVG